MASQRVASRQERSREIDSLIVRVTIELLNDVGPDRFTIAELARRCGLTTGAVYRRYDSVDDILKEIWRECWPSLLKFTEGSYYGGTRSEAEFEFAVSQFVAPSSEARAAALIVSCARRVPLIEQEVRRSLELYCSPSASTDPVEQGLRFASLSLTLGRCLISKIVTVDESALREVSRLMIGTPEGQDLVQVDVSPNVFSLVNEGHVDPDLLEAGISLISQVGFEGTTASRIARQTGRPYSQFIKQFSSKSDLMEMLIQELIPPSLDFENQMRDAQGPSESGAALLSWNADENAVVRKVVAEIILVANARDSMREMVAANFAARARILSDLGVDGIDLVRGAWHFGNAYFVGMSALGLLVSTIGMDFSGAITALISMREMVTEAVIAGLQDVPDPEQIL